MYQDVLDPSRLVKIVKRGEDYHRCRVYFPADRGSGWVYHGETDISTNLFDPDPSDPKDVTHRIGFRRVSNS